MSNGRFNVDRNRILSTVKVNKTVSSLMTSLLKSTCKEAHRKPALRPSSMPFCSIKVLKDLILREKNEETMKSDFYMSVGTTLHSVIQKWLPRLGKGFGNWKCLVEGCGKTKMLTTDRVCECGAPMQYEEIEVAYKGVTGHIDYIIKDPKLGKGMQVLDFKTGSLEKILKKDVATLVSYSYMMQILTYTYIVQELYGWKMVGSSLLFIARDAPDKYVEMFFPWTTEVSDMIAEFVDAQILGFNSARQSLEERDSYHAIKSRLCRNDNHYQKDIKNVFFGGCKLYSACVGLSELQTIKKYLDKELSFL